MQGRPPEITQLVESCADQLEPRRMGALQRPILGARRHYSRQGHGPVLNQVRMSEILDFFFVRNGQGPDKKISPFGTS